MERIGFMRYLPINVCLSEEERIQSITFNENVYDLYHGSGDRFDIYYVTEHNQPDRILMAIKKDLWNIIFEC